MDVQQIRQHLEEIPLILVNAIGRPEKLVSFAKEWSALGKVVKQARDASMLDDQDVALASAVATLVATLTNASSDIEHESNTTSTVFLDEVEGILSRMTITDTSSATIMKQSLIPRYRCSPVYIPPAYAWLLQNLHNPYPSAKVKRQLSRKSGYSIHALSDWFKDVHRHIGWTTLCKTHFRGSRTLAVEAAHQVFFERHTACTVAPHVISDFEALRTRLEDLFSWDNVASDEDTIPPVTGQHLCPPAATSSSRTSSPPSVRSSPSASTPSLTFTSDDESDFSLSDIPDLPIFNTGSAPKYPGTGRYQGTSQPLPHTPLISLDNVSLSPLRGVLGVDALPRPGAMSSLHKRPRSSEDEGSIVPAKRLCRSPPHKSIMSDPLPPSDGAAHNAANEPTQAQADELTIQLFSDWDLMGASFVSSLGEKSWPAGDDATSTLLPDIFDGGQYMGLPGFSQLPDLDAIGSPRLAATSGDIASAIPTQTTFLPHIAPTEFLQDSHISTIHPDLADLDLVPQLGFETFDFGTFFDSFLTTSSLETAVGCEVPVLDLPTTSSCT